MSFPDTPEGTTHHEYDSCNGGKGHHSTENEGLEEAKAIIESRRTWLDHHGLMLTDHQIEHLKEKSLGPAIALALATARVEGAKEMLKGILHAYNESSFEKKGFDFYFAIRTRLDDLNAKQETP